MFGVIIEKLYIGLLNLFKIRRFCKSLAFNSKESIKCVSLKNELSQTRPTLININSAMKFLFIHLLLVLVSIVKVVTLLIIHVVKFVF